MDVAAHSASYITGDAAFAVDGQGVIVLWNKEAERLLGYPASSALGQRCWKLLSGQDVFGNRYCCEFCPLREMASRQESVHGFPLVLRTASEGGKKFPVSCLEVFDKPGHGLLLHICHPPQESRDASKNHHAPGRFTGNCQRGALTSREHDVLELLAEGKTTREIASTMCVSQATARNHIQHVLHKLHVHNRLEAVVKGQHLDLI